MCFSAGWLVATVSVGTIFFDLCESLSKHFWEQYPWFEQSAHLISATWPHGLKSLNPSEKNS